MTDSTTIVLTGFSFTGKSEVGRKVALQLGWRFIDSDEEIVSQAGKDIVEIFSHDGEEKFRDLEREVLSRICLQECAVIATGGGAVMDSMNRQLFEERCVEICLEAMPHTIYQRLQAVQETYRTIRPLLAVAQPLEHIQSLKISRQQFYDMADWSVSTDNLTMDQVADRVIYAYKQVIARKRSPSYFDGASFLAVTSMQTYPVFVGWGIKNELGNRMLQTRLGISANIISDDRVFSHYGSELSRCLKEAGFNVESLVVPQGEGSKTMDTAIRIYDWLVDQRVERGHTIVALGGGMVGDLAGFAAATFLRGIPMVQVPTTLVAMADSSIGGKVAVNHPRAKNIIGAYYQPHLVCADISTLSTLPKRELNSGWAEVIKHAMTLDPDLLHFLERNSERLKRLEAESTAEAIRRSAYIKAMVVSEDEKEQGKRMILNYGHTIAHGLEAATNYERFLHGEAVAIGMMGAAMISQRLGLVTQKLVTQQKELLERYGLPTAYSQVPLSRLVNAMELDKKVRQKALTWVLLNGISNTLYRNDVPMQEVYSVLEELSVN